MTISSQFRGRSQEVVTWEVEQHKSAHQVKGHCVAFAQHIESYRPLETCGHPWCYADGIPLCRLAPLKTKRAFVAAQGEFDAVDQAPRAVVCEKDRQRCAEIEQANLLFAMTDQATVSMSANQISLLSLARLSSSACRTQDRSRCPNPYLRQRSGTDEPWNKPHGMARMTVFVAFNDTDDLLGFELPPFLADTDGNLYVNITVRNPGFILPGLFKDPSAAHTNQARNPAVIEAITEGFKIPR